MRAVPIVAALAISLVGSAALAQRHIRSHATIVRPSFDRPTVVRPSFDRPTMARPSFDRARVERHSFDRVQAAMRVDRQQWDRHVARPRTLDRDRPRLERAPGPLRRGLTRLRPGAGEGASPQAVTTRPSRSTRQVRRQSRPVEPAQPPRKIEKLNARLHCAFGLDCARTSSTARSLIRQKSVDEMNPRERRYVEHVIALMRAHMARNMGLAGK